ncbi:MAG: Ig-like domain-containing protein [Mariprofundaceae bacterium]|nr:Ig-like domain-containing protein [Mariprofundaceae bacterium]
MAITKKTIKEVWQRLSKSEPIAKAPLLSIMPLEDRIVLDGGLVGEALSIGLDAPSPTALRNVALIASDAPDIQGITAAFAASNTQVIVIDAQASQADILNQLTQLSADARAPIASISLFSHARSGSFQLGQTAVSGDNVGDLANIWQAIDAALVDGGNFNLYGCNLAADGNGQQLINDIASQTNAQVYGSNDISGQSGDWVLEISSQGAQAFDVANTVVDEALLSQVQGDLLFTVTTVGADTAAPFITKDVRPTFQGGASIGAQMTMSISNGAGAVVQTGSTFGGGGGTWSWNAPANLVDGNYTLTIADANNTALAPIAVAFSVDTVAPALVYSTPASTGLTSPTITGTVTDPASVVTVTISVTGGTSQVLTAAVDAVGNWATTPVTPLVAGTVYSVSVTAHDAAGNADQNNISLRPLAVTLPATPHTLTAIGATNTAVANGTGDSRFSIKLDVVNNLGATVQSVVTPISTNVLGASVWSHNFQGLGDGVYTVSATQVDSNNPATVMNIALSTAMTLDRTALAPALVSVTGATVIGGQNYINNITPSLVGGIGSVEAGATISLTETTAGIAATTIPAVTALANGSWSLVFPTLSNGQHTFAVNQTDVLGNSSQSTIITFTVDTAVTGLSIAPTATSAVSFPTISGTAEPSADPATVPHTVSVTVSSGVNAIVVINNVAVDAAGNWSVAVPRTNPLTAAAIQPLNGVYTVTVNQTDALSNIAIPVTQSLTVNTLVAQPSISLAATVANPALVQTPVLLNGVGINGATIQVTATNMATLVQTILTTTPIVTNGLWSLTNTGLVAANLVDGNYSFSVVQIVDVAASPASTVFGTSAAINSLQNLQIDTVVVAPVIATINGAGVVGAAHGTNLNTLSAVVGVEANASANIVLTDSLGAIVDQRTLTALPATPTNITYTAPQNIVDGLYTLTVTQTDAASNQSIASAIALTVDTVALAPVVNAIETSTTAVFVDLATGVKYVNATTGPVTFTGTAEAGATISVANLTVVNALGVVTALSPLPSVLVGVNGAWSLVVTTPVGTSLAAGAQTAQITQTDVLANTSTASNMNFVIDQVVSNFTLPAIPAQTSSFPVITGTGETGGSVVVTVSGLGLVTPLTLNAGPIAQGSWSVTVPQNLVNGNYTVNATFTDIAQNALAAAPVTMSIAAVVDPPSLNVATPTKSGVLDPAVIKGIGIVGSTVNISVTDTVTAAVVGNYVVTVAANGAATTNTWSLTNNLLIDALGVALVDKSYQVSVTQTTTAANAGNAGGVVGTSAATVGTVVLDNIASAPVVATIDATLPPLPLPVGTVNAGAIEFVTNNTRPNIAFNLEPGSTLELTLNGAALTSLQDIGNTGVITFTPNAALSAVVTPPATFAQHTLLATQVDIAGNRSALSTVLIDVDMQVGAVTANPVGTLFGVTQVVNSAQMANFTLSGTGEVGATVTVSGLNTVGLGGLVAPMVPAVVTVDVLGNWTHTFAAGTILAEGAQRATLTQQDNVAYAKLNPISSLGVQNTAVSTVLDFSVDTTVTPLTIDSLGTALAPATISTTNRPLIQGTAEANRNAAIATTVNVQVFNVANPLAPVLVGTFAPIADPLTGQWSVSNAMYLASLANGSYSATVTQMDEAGNTLSSSQVFTVATTVASPAFDPLMPSAASPGLAATPVISGTATVHGAQIHLTATAVADALGTPVVGAIPIVLADALTNPILVNGTQWSLANTVLNPLVGLPLLADGFYQINVSQVLPDGANATLVGSSLATSQVLQIDTVAAPFNVTIDPITFKVESLVSYPVIAGVAEIAPVGGVATVAVVVSSQIPVGSPVGTLPATTVTMNATVDALGNWSTAVTQALANGLYDINLTQTDHLGNTATLLSTLNVNATVPVPTLTLPTSPTQLLGTGNPLTSQTFLIQGDSGGGVPPVPQGSTVNISLHSIAALALNPLAPPSLLTTATVGDPAVVGNQPTAWALTNQALVQALLADGEYQVTVTQTTLAPSGFDRIGTSASIVGRFVIDTAALSPVVNLVDAVAPALGNVVNTANLTPSIQLSVEPGATVRISVNGLLQTPVVANNLGQLTFVPTLTQMNAGATAAANSIVFSQVDEAGNASPVATTLTINVDNAALAPAASLDQAAMTLANPTALVTVLGTQTFVNTATPILSGSAEPGASITITGLNPVPAAPITVLAVTDVFGVTTWSAVLPVLAQGAQSLSIIQTDALLNVSPATLVNFTVDTAVIGFAYNGIDPITTTIPSASSFPVLSGSAEVAVGNTAYQVNVTVVSQVAAGQIPGINIASTAAVDAQGAWQVDLGALVPAGLANGLYTVTATMTDAAQNSATITNTLDVNKQVLAPVLNASTTAVNPSLANTPVILNGLAGSVEALAVVNIEIVQGATVLQTHQVTADNTGAWFIPNSAIATPPLGVATLADGNYIIRVSQTTVAATSLVSLSPLAIDTVAQTVVINTIDAVAPALGATSVTTNNLTPTVTLTIEPGATLNVTVNGVLSINVATADPVTGVVSFILPTLNASALGTANSLTFTQTDIAGNTNIVGSNMGIVVDNATTGLSINPVGTLLGANDVVGGLGGNQPILTGSGEAGATVNVQVFDVATNTLVTTLPPALVGAAVGGIATWSATVPIALLDGAYSVQVTQTDLVGNSTVVGQEVIRNFSVDTTVTPLSMTSLASVTTTSYPTLTGVAEFNRGATLSQVSINISNAAGNVALAAPIAIPAVTVTQQAGAGLTGAWSTVIDTPLSNGSYTVTVTQTDELGNVASFVQTLTVNTAVASPTLVLSPSDAVGGTTNPATQLTTLVSGTGLAGATINLFAVQTADILGNLIPIVNQVPVTLTPVVVDAAGLWQMNLVNQQSSMGVLPDGSYSIRASQTTANLANPTLDPAAATYIVGTSLEAMQSLVIDKTAQAPVVNPVGQLLGGVRVANATPVMTGTAEANATVQVSGLIALNNTPLPIQTVVANALGAWQLNILTPLQQGVQTANVVQVDILKNTSISTVLNFEVDSSVTNLTVLAGQQGTLNPVISGTAEIPRGATAATVTVTVTDPINANTVISVVPNVAVNSLNGTWSTTLPAFAAMGSFDVTVTQTDETGNVGSAFQTLTLVPLNPPTILFPNVTNLPATAVGTSSTVSGTADFNVPVKITFTQVDSLANPLAPASLPVVMTTVADGLGNWALDNTALATALGAGPSQYYQISTIQGLGSANASPIDIKPGLMQVDTVAPAAPLPTFNSLAAVPVEGENFTIAVHGEIGTSTNITFVAIAPNVNISPAVSFISPQLVADPLIVPPALPQGLATSQGISLLAGNYQMTTVLTDTAGNSSSVTQTINIAAPQPNVINVVQAPVATDTNAVLFNDPNQLSGAPVIVSANGNITGASPTILNLHPTIDPLTGLSTNDAFNQIQRPIDPLTGLAIQTSLKAGVSSAGINPITGAASGIDPVTGANVSTVITNNASPLISGQLPVASVQTVDIFFKAVNPATGAETLDFLVPVTTNALGQWTVDLAAQGLVLADGLHRIFASGIGIGGVSNTFDMVVDTQKPISPVILNMAPTAANGGVPQVAGTFDLIGTAEPGSRVIVQMNPTFVVTADALGNWSITGITLTPNTNYRMFLFSVDIATNTTMVTPFNFTVNKVGGVVINAPTTYVTDPSSPTVVLAGTVIIDGLLENITTQAINNNLADIWAKSQQHGGLLEDIRLAAINGIPVEPIDQKRLNPSDMPADRIEDNGYIGYLRISAESPDLNATANETLDRTSKSRFRNALNHLQQAETTIGHGNRLTEGRIAMFAPEFQLGETQMNMNDAFAVLDDDAKLRLFAMDDRNVRIHFDFDQYALQKEGVNDMSVFSDWINREWGQWIGVWGSQHIHVVGHTDFIGTVEYNDKLGMRRAFVAGEYLVKHLGFAVEHISFDSWGKDAPVDLGESDESRAQNRRVEINIGDTETISPKFPSDSEVGKLSVIQRDFIQFLQTGDFGRFSKE